VNPCGPENRRPIIVLLVDDQRFVGAALGHLLAGEPDIDLHCCHQATSAIAMANRLHPSLILQDLVMPDVDGLTLVGMFRANEATVRTPVIVLSGDDSASHRTRALEAGANDYLVKLPAREDLVSCIRRHVAGHPSAREREDDGRPPASDPLGVTLDPSVLAALREAGSAASPGFFEHLVEQFTQEAESRVQAIEDAARLSDTDTLTRAAHSLKGAALVAGAARLGALCGRLEGAIASGGGPPADAVITEIGQELGRVKDAFAVERTKTGIGRPIGS